MKQYIIRLLFKVDASGLKKQLQSISKEAARVGAAMAKSMNRAFKTVAKQGGAASKQVVKSLDNIEKKSKTSSRNVKTNFSKVDQQLSVLGKKAGQFAIALAGAFAGQKLLSGIKTSIDNFAKLEIGMAKLQAAANSFGADFKTIRDDLIAIRKEGVLSFDTLNYVARQLVTPAIGVASDEVGKFIIALRNIAAVEGIYEDLDFSITSFVRGLQTGTAELLENLSPRIRAFIKTEAGGFAAVQKDQAARQKLFNELLESGNKLQGAYEELLDSTTFRTQQLNVATKELSETIGEGLAPAYNELLLILTDTIKGMTNFAQSMTIAERGAKTLTTGMQALFTVGGGIAGAFLGGPMGAAVGGLLGFSIGAEYVDLTTNSIENFIRKSQRLSSISKELADIQTEIEKLSSSDPEKNIEKINRLKEKQLELEKEILDRLKSQGLSVDNLRTAYRQLGIEQKRTLAQTQRGELAAMLGVRRFNLIADIESGQMKTRGSVPVPVGVNRRFFEDFTDVLQSVAELGPTQKSLKEVERLLDVISKFKNQDSKNVKRFTNTLELLQASISSILALEFKPKADTPLIAGGTGGATMGAAGGTPLSIGQRLDLDLEGQLIEIERSYNRSTKALEDFREKALNPATEEYKILKKTLENTGISNAKYLNSLKREIDTKKELAISSAIVEDGLEKINDTLRELDDSAEVFRRLASGINTLSDSLQELDGTVLGALKGITGATGAISDVFKGLAKAQASELEFKKSSNKLQVGEAESLTESILQNLNIGFAFEKISLIGGILAGIQGIFSSQLFAAPADDRLFIETIEIKDVGLKQLEILERQYELQRQLAQVESDYYQNNLKALDLIEQKTGVSQAQQRFDLAIAELARLQSGASVAQFERLSESERERLIEQARGVATQEGFESQIKNVKEIGIAAVGSQALLDELSKESPDLFKVFDLFTPELIERFPEIYEYIKKVRAARLYDTPIDEGTTDSSGGTTFIDDNQVFLPPSFFGSFKPGPPPSGYVTGTTQVIETTDGGTQSLLQAFFGSLSEGLLELQNVNDNSNQILNAINSAITYNNELTNKIAENTSLQQIQPRGFGAVDVSRGGLAFGRDFIPTAASLISNVGVPAQIGSLSVAAEANKTMDQKMLDSLQNQLIELKAQTNLLAQLTNTDARIVIANAQQAVKATGF